MNNKKIRIQNKYIRKKNNNLWDISKNEKYPKNVIYSKRIDPKIISQMPEEIDTFLEQKSIFDYIVNLIKSY